MHNANDEEEKNQKTKQREGLTSKCFQQNM